MKRWLPILIILAILIVPGLILPRFSTEAVTASVAVTPEVLFSLGGFKISNTLFTSWIVMILITLFAFVSTRKMSLVPSGWQNLMEIIIEGLDGLCTSVAGNRGKKFFPIVATIFLFVLFSNWLGLLPGFGPVGIIPIKEGGHAPAGITTFDLPKEIANSLGAHAGEDTHAAEKPSTDSHATEKPGEPKAGSPAAEVESEMLLAPFFRSPSTDINTTLALALISVILTQIFGMQVVGVLKYWTKFFNFDKIGKFFGSLFKGKPDFGALFYGFIDLFVGLLEFISEMVKILSFTFRLFGNIFAGEVVLLIMTFLFFALPFPFYGLEIFVGFMQAFVFAILTLVFMTIATTAHGAAEHH